MELSSPAAYEQPGPVATVYLEARPPSEDAAAQVRLRWHDLAEQLRSELPPALQGLVVDTEHGARAAGAAPEPLERALCEIADRVTREQADEALERLRDRQTERRGTEGLQTPPRPRS